MKVLQSNLSRIKDPTQQGKNRAKARKHFNTEVSASSVLINEWINNVPFTKSQSGNITYLLPSDPNDYIEGVLLAATALNGGFFLNQNIEASFRSGVLASNRDMQQLLSSPKSTLPITSYNFDSTLHSREYRDSLSYSQLSASNSVNGAVKDSAAKISSLILLAMASGMAVDEILKKVNEQIESLKERVEKTITTSINYGSNQGKLIGIGLASLALNLEPLVRHRSARLVTTRGTHASRHGKIYTVAEQSEWWATGSNKINCYCSVVPVIKQ